MEEQEYVDTPTLAKLAGVTREIITTDIRLGILPAEKRADSRSVRWGGCWFIRTDDAQRYIGTRAEMRKTVPQSISAREFGRRTGQDRHNLMGAIQRGDIRSVRLSEGRNSPWYILEEDAKAYSERMGWQYVIEEARPEVGTQIRSNRRVGRPVNTGTPDRCGSCGTDKGNILGDIDADSHERRGYLCAKCLRLVREFHGDPRRMRKTLAYIERTRAIVYNGKQ